MKILTALIVLLFGSGIALTLYLPAPIQQAKPEVEIDKASLKAPLDNSSIRQTLNSPDDQKYGLQLGLYSTLSLATDEAHRHVQSSVLKHSITIFTLQDSQQAWHALIAGPIDTKENAFQQQSELTATSQIVLWPTSSKKGKS